MSEKLFNKYMRAENAVIGNCTFHFVKYAIALIFAMDSRLYLYFSFKPLFLNAVDFDEVCMNII